MNAPITIDAALADPELLGAALGPIDTWAIWLAVLKAAFGDKLTRSERRAFESVAGSRRAPKEKVAELWCIVGRRAGKSRMAAAVAAFLACFIEHDLDPGERGYILCLAATAAQAKVVFDYTESFLRSSPILETIVDSVTSDEIRLINGVIVAIHVSSYRHVRGKTLLAVIADEISYWRSDESANPDREVMRAVKPSLASAGGMLVAISSPYRKVGVLFERHRDYFGTDDDHILVIQAETRILNPTIDPKIVARSHKEDPEAARAEWDAEFRSDIGALFDDRVVDDAIDHSRPLELPPRRNCNYHAFTDASAGRHDAFTICIGHIEGEVFICDSIRGVAAPFDPRTVSIEFSQLAREYGCKKIVGDSFAGEWVAAAFKDAGVRYETSKLNRSQLYLEALPLFNRGSVRLPNYSRLSRELRLLERRVSRSGKDSVDHPAHGSDDYANALCGCLYSATSEARRPKMRFGTFNAYSGGGKITYHDLQPARPRIRVVRVSE